MIRIPRDTVTHDNINKQFLKNINDVRKFHYFYNNRKGYVSPSEI